MEPKASSLPPPRDFCPPSKIPFQLPQPIPNLILTPHQPSFLGNKLLDGRWLLPRSCGFHERTLLCPTGACSTPTPTHRGKLYERREELGGRAGPTQATKGDIFTSICWFCISELGWGKHGCYILTPGTPKGPERNNRGIFKSCLVPQRHMASCAQGLAPMLLSSCLGL